jgi:hypothetical protein
MYFSHRLMVGVFAPLNYYCISDANCLDLSFICDCVFVLFPSCARAYCATSRKVAGSIPDEVTGFFNIPNPYSRNLALGSTQRLKETSTRNLPGGKGRPARKADNLTAISEPIV